MCAHASEAWGCTTFHILRTAFYQAISFSRGQVRHVTSSAKQKAPGLAWQMDV